MTRFPCPHNQQGLHGEHLHDCPGGCEGSGFVVVAGRAGEDVGPLFAILASLVIVVVLLVAVFKACFP